MNRLKQLWMNRETRVAAALLGLLVLGTVALRTEHPALGIELFILASGLAVAFWMFVIRPARIPSDAVVLLRLSGPIPEEARRSPLDQLLRRSSISLAQLRYGLEGAATDRNVRALIVRLSGVEAGMATAHEIHRLLRAIVTAGKRVIAVITGDSTELPEYLIAAGASEIVMNPDSTLSMLGVAFGNPFLRDALDNVGIRAQTLQWKEYKGAAEMLSRDAMSPELRESLTAIIHDRLTVVAEALATARHLPIERIRELLSAGFMTARGACEAKLVDREGHSQDVRAELDPDGKRKSEVSFGRLVHRIAYQRERGMRPQIAMVLGAGPVIAGEPPPAGDFISGETTSDLIDRASRDDDIRAIVFRINSPGGSAVGSEMVWRAVREAQKRGKPVVVSMGDVAGSGGYYVAMGADAIVAEPATITGSIGVVYMKLDLSRMFSRVGVRFDYAKSADISDALSLSRGMTDPELAQLNGALGELYHNFTAKVAQGRKLSAEQTEEVARGRVWSGLAAKERGLVDELGGFSRAIEIARQKAGIPTEQPHELITFTARERILSLRHLFGSASVSWTSDVVARTLKIPTGWAPGMLSLLMRGGMMLLAPFLTE